MVKESVAGRDPRPARDRSAKPPSPRFRRFWPVALLAVAWVALAFSGGGLVDGSDDASRAATAAFLAVVLGAATAAWVLWAHVPARILRSGPAALALGGLAGLAAWSAVTIAWAAAPDLAWIAANRGVVVVAALLVGMAVAAACPRPGASVSAGLAAAMVPVTLWALATKVLPTVAGTDLEPARLSSPLGYWNALGLLLALSLPGTLWLGARTGARPWHRALAGAWTAVLVTTLLLTYSRGGLMVAAVAVAVAVWLVPPRWPAVGVLAAGVAGAVLPAVYGLTADVLTTDRVPAADRRDAGLGLGWRIVVGAAVAAALVLLAIRVAPRLAPHAAALRRGAVVALLAGVVAIGVVGAVRHEDVGGWIGDRVSSLDGGGVGNDPSRVTSVNPNQRLDWWAEAARGFADAPLGGNGAGGFRLTHLRERTGVVSPREEIRSPHQATLQVMSETGLLGLALYLAALTGIAWGAIRAVRRRLDPTAGLAVAIVVAFILHTQIDFTWDIPAVAAAGLLPAGALVGAAVGPGERGAPLRAWWLAPVLAAGAALVAVSAFLPWMAAREVQDGLSGDPYGHASTARSLNPLSIAPDRILVVPVAVAAGDRVRALDAARRAARTQPDNPQAWVLVLQAGAVGDEARHARERIRALDPLGTLP